LYKFIAVHKQILSQYFGLSFLLSKVIDTLLFIFTFIVFLLHTFILAIIAYMPLVMMRIRGMLKPEAEQESSYRSVEGREGK